jgi:hypothetical protein
MFVGRDETKILNGEGPKYILNGLENNGGLGPFIFGKTPTIFFIFFNEVGGDHGSAGPLLVGDVRTRLAPRGVAAMRLFNRFKGDHTAIPSSQRWRQCHPFSFLRVTERPPLCFSFIFIFYK